MSVLLVNFHSGRAAHRTTVNLFAGLAFTDKAQRKGHHGERNNEQARKYPFVRTLWCGNAPSSPRSCVRP